MSHKCKNCSVDVVNPYQILRSHEDYGYVICKECEQKPQRETDVEYIQVS